MSAKSSFSGAYQLLGNFWLHEISPGDIPTIKHLPDLGDTLPVDTAIDLTDLAAEYQRLFGFNLPPYESLFIDPSGMLNAPATTRVDTLYRQAGWSPPTKARYGAPDHLGLELLALGAFAQQSDPTNYEMLLIKHLALWVPVFTLTLRRLKPHPFYAGLGELTLDFVLESLPASPLAPDTDPFPILPPPPIYRSTFQEPPLKVGTNVVTETEESKQTSSQRTNLEDILKKLLTARQAGLYITRQDLAKIGITLDLPGVMGERVHMLKTLLQMAAQYDLIPHLFELLQSLLDMAHDNYSELAATNPAWQVYARGWVSRLDATRELLQDLHAQSLHPNQ